MHKFGLSLTLGLCSLWSYAQSPSSTETLQRLIALPLKNIFVEYPNKTSYIQIDSTELGLAPHELHPAFYGCFDWHSAVHSHWMLAEVLTSVPNLAERTTIISAFDQHLTPEKMRGEAAYFDRKLASFFQRTYGWAWLLQLSSQLQRLEQETQEPLLKLKAKQWHEAVDLLAAQIVSKWKAYLPKLTYPNRIGTHSNSAFALAFALDYAVRRGDKDFEQALKAKARELYLQDKAIPAQLEPNATDFLSPSLMTADLMSRVLSPSEYRKWLRSYFTPRGIERLCQPLVVGDLTDYNMVHLVGLSFSRAWAMARIARALPSEDKLGQRFARMAPRFYEQGMAQIFATGYGGEHWLATFARYADQVIKGAHQ